MDPQEGDIADLPDGRTATFSGGRWVVQAEGGQGQDGWQVRPMQSPDDQRADARLSLAEDSAARAARNEERRIAMEGQTQGRQGIQSETDLRKEFNALPDVREFPVVSAQYNMVKQAAGRGTAAGDLSLIFAFMKILDPGSVVREQEFDNAQNAGGIPDRFQALVGRLRAGERLSENQRADFVTQARGAFETRAVQYNERVNYYRGLAEQYGHSPDNIGSPVEIETAPISINQQDTAESPNALSAQGYKYDGERDVWYRPTDPAAAAENAQTARQNDQGIGRRIDSFARGVADGASFGLADEFAAGMNTLLPLDRGSVSGFAGGGFREAFDQNLAVQRGVDAADAQQMPLTRGAGQIAGGIAAPGAVAGGRYIAAAPNLMTAGVRGAQVGGAAGAAYGAGSSNGDRLADAGRSAVTGAMLGGPLGAGGRAVGSAIGGRMMTSPRSQAVRTLQDNGVSLTPGQAMGGPVQTIENLAQRAPILGPAIRGARERGVESLNRAVGNRALDAIGEGVPADVPVGGDMVGYTADRLGQQFERGYGMIPRFQADESLVSGLQRVGQGKADLPPAIQQQFDTIIGERLARLGTGEVTGQQVGTIRTELNTLASGYLRSQDPAQQGLGRLLSGVTEELDSAVERSSPEAGRVLAQARDGWGDYIRLERASTAAGGRPFSPGQLETAVRQSDGSVRRGAMGRNDARMQDLSSAARTVMPDQFGNPGTADAVGLGGLGVGMITEPVTTTGVAAGLGVASVPYFAMGRRIVERLPANASRQQLEAAAAELDTLARQDGNVIVLRDEIARRIGQMVPAGAQATTPRQQQPPRLMTAGRSGQ